MAAIACDWYLTPDGRRELVLLDGPAGSRLLVDRREDGGGDARLLAALAADEPDQNARLVCREFLADPWRGARPLRANDFKVRSEARDDGAATAFDATVLTDGSGRRYALRESSSPRELRWQRESRREDDPARRVSTRDVVAALEDYEAVRVLSHAAIARYRCDRSVSVSTLALELRRLEASPIILNRRLREAVLAAVHDRGTSLSAIAMACGRVKYDRRGNGSGETSWLARRIGLLPSSPGSRPNPWVHSDTLGLIARNGLGLAPREVELP